MKTVLTGIAPLVVNDQTRRFLGTGIVVSPSVILTCAHVLSTANSTLFEGIFSENEFYSAGEVCASVGSATHQALRICCQHVPGSLDDSVFLGDFACVHFEELPGLVPVRLCRSRKLRGHKFHAEAFVSELLGPRPRIVPEIEVTHDEYASHTGAVQYVQVNGGFPAGFSGGAVLAPGPERRVVGMLQVGGTRSATSRFIAIDALADFILAQSPGITFDTFDEEPPTPAKREPGGGITQVVAQGDLTNVTVTNTQVAEIRNR